MKFVTRPNSWVSQDVAATTQFTYGLQLNPAPLTVSISGSDPILGALQFVITNPTASAIALSSIAFTIQVGTDSSDLTTTTANVGASVSDSTDWQIQTPGTITSGPAVYTLAPKTGSSVSVAAGASIIVEIDNFPTVENPGNTTINVKETVGSTIGFTSFMVTTFPSGFYFNGLSATIENGSQLVPTAQVVTGATVTLVWNSSVVDLASFTVDCSNAAQGQQSATPTDTGLWISEPLTADTVFTIVVTVSVAGGTPLTAALSTAIAVQNPSLIAASLTAGTAAVNGPLTVSGDTQANGITATDITATGLVVNGNVQASNLATGGNLSVSGNATIAIAAISKNLTATASTVSMLTTLLPISPSTYTPSTDGFILGIVSAPDDSTRSSLCTTTISAQTQGITVRTLGGNVGSWDSSWSTQYMCPNSQSFLMPVTNGHSFSIGVYNDPSNEVNAPTAFYWIPLGTPTGPTLEKLSDDQPLVTQHMSVVANPARSKVPIT